MFNYNFDKQDSEDYLKGYEDGMKDGKISGFLKAVEIIKKKLDNEE